MLKHVWMLIPLRRTLPADSINQTFMFYLCQSDQALWHRPGCLILMPARGLGLNLDYAKNEADRGSRHRSLVSCPVKTISFSPLFFLSFMSLLFSLPPLTPPTAIHYSPVFVFPLRGRRIPFSHALRAGAAGWSLLCGTHKCLLMATDTLVGWHEVAQHANAHSEGLLMCLWRCHKSFVRLQTSLLHLLLWYCNTESPQLQNYAAHLQQNETNKQSNTPDLFPEKMQITFLYLSKSFDSFIINWSYVTTQCTPTKSENLKTESETLCRNKVKRKWSQISIFHHREEIHCLNKK